MDVVVWLRSLGLEEYEAAFRDNKIDERVLPNLTQEDLKEIGVGPVGHRRILLDAIVALRNHGSADSVSHGSKRSSICSNAYCRARRRSLWRAPTCRSDVLRSCGFDQHRCGA
jgi:hypothetical protein